MKALNKKLASSEKDYQRLKTQLKSDAEQHEKDLEGMEGKLNESRRTVEVTKRKLETAENTLSRTSQGKNDLNKTLEKMEKELASVKKSTADTVHQIKSEKIKLEKENKEAACKIAKMSDENVKLKSQLNDEVQDLSRTLNITKSELTAMSKAKTQLEEAKKELEQKRDHDIAQALKSKEAELNVKDQEKDQLIKDAEIKEKKYLMDLLNAKAEATEAMNKLTDELKKVEVELRSKTEALERLEKAKKEVSAAKEKALKKANRYL